MCNCHKWESCSRLLYLYYNFLCYTVFDLFGLILVIFGRLLQIYNQFCCFAFTNHIVGCDYLISEMLTFNPG